MIKTAKPRSGRPRRDAREKIHKVRSFRVRPSLDAMLMATAEDSGRSVSEEIERALDRSLDSTALLNMLVGEHSPDAVRLLGLITRAMQMPSMAEWTKDKEEARALFKAVVNLLIERISVGSFTVDEMNATPAEIDIEKDAKVAVFVLMNPRESWIRPASAEIHQLRPRSD
jgi:hypothetical protein